MRGVLTLSVRYGAVEMTALLLLLLLLLLLPNCPSTPARVTVKNIYLPRRPVHCCKALTALLQTINAPELLAGIHRKLF